MTDKHENILLPFFLTLRRFIPLGIDDYLFVLQILHRGIGVKDLEDMWFTCRLLWAKSLEDQEIFDREFARLVVPFFTSIYQKSTEEQDDTTQNEVTPSTSSSTKEREEPKRERESDQHSVAGREGTFSLAIPAEVRASEGGPWAIGSYQLQPRLPLSRRELAGVWRHLRRLRRDGIPIDLDVEGTIINICQNGYFLRPMMQPRHRNQLRLLLLIDCSPSMTPFGYITDALIESMDRGGLHGQVYVNWIGNDPNVIGMNAKLNLTRPATVAFTQLPHEITAIIISDAGATHGAYRPERIEATRKFLHTLHEHTYRYAWINPLPRTRWEFSSAADIASMVPMYSLTREDLLDVVDILRGRPFPSEVQLHDEH